MIPPRLLDPDRHGGEHLWQAQETCFCPVSFALCGASPDEGSRARGFGALTRPWATRQRRLLDTLDATIYDYLAGGVARQMACAAIADVLVG